MKRLLKIGAEVILTLTLLGSLLTPLLIQGCATQSPLFSTRNDKASLIVEKPPMRILISGEYTNIDAEEILSIMKELRKHKYHEYHFDESISINSEHISSTTEKIETKHRRGR